MSRSTPNQSRKLHQGQALVEYAILLILLVTLFVGGTELGLTSLASSKNTEAAKTGISEYAEVNQQRLNILNTEKQYLITLAGYGCSVIYEITNAYDETNDVYLKADGVISTTYSRESLNADLSDYTCTKPSDTQADAEISAAIVYSSIVQLLDEVYIGDSTVYTSLSDVANSLLKLANYRDTVTTGLNSASEIIKGLDENGNGVLTISELADGESVLLNAYVGSEISDAEVRKLEGQLKYRALLLISHYKLSQLPLLTDVDNNNLDDVYLSQATIKIGDHNIGITPASCGGSEGAYTYSDGFPANTRYIYKAYLDQNDVRYTYQTGDTVYLFNPLPIDVDSCIGFDNQRGGQPRIRILIDGYTPPKTLIDDSDDFNNLFVPGLPKLNQAMYSNYENVCVDSSNAYVACTSSNVAQRWLKPPGKICFNNALVTGLDSCIGQPNTSLEASDNSYGPTGFYFFGNPNDSALHSFQYTQNETPEFRPALQIECSTSPNSNSDAVMDTNCSSAHSKVRIHTRYRRVFEGFLTFGLMSLTNTDLLPYFYNPNQVGVDGSTVIIGSYGSEVGPLSSLNGPPTIKHFMDFRGCYEVDVETNQVSACN